MFNMQLLNPQTIELDGWQQRTSLTAGQAGKIVNIAGIDTGDTVFFAGMPDGTLEAAVMARAARFVSGERAPWSGRDHNGADVSLCHVSELRSPETARLLRIFRRCLRPGGRMVIWTPPDRTFCSSSLTDQFQELADNTGFTSVIVGRLPSERGRGEVVATGILNK
jgi:hypothetical protein